MAGYSCSSKSAAVLHLAATADQSDHIVRAVAGILRLLMWGHHAARVPGPLPNEAPRPTAANNRLTFGRSWMWGILKEDQQSNQKNFPDAKPSVIDQIIVANLVCS